MASYSNQLVLSGLASVDPMVEQVEPVERHSTTVEWQSAQSSSLSVVLVISASYLFASFIAVEVFDREPERFAVPSMLPNHVNSSVAMEPLQSRRLGVACSSRWVPKFVETGFASKPKHCLQTQLVTQPEPHL